ncbi:hypothetical protein XENOCAPTIV_013437 [Xenoophorus captivus]|uniref:Uncharacterized protein n=1 Tax=Xenoophorus captivus TaxID=1517983 RepID=A0ABV0SAL0_9TELE
MTVKGKIFSSKAFTLVLVILGIIQGWFQAIYGHKGDCAKVQHYLSLYLACNGSECLEIFLNGLEQQLPRLPEGFSRCFFELWLLSSEGFKKIRKLNMWGIKAVVVLKQII